MRLGLDEGPRHEPVRGAGCVADASPDEIRRAYLTLARRHHPDAGGNADEMRRLNEAWAALSARPPLPPARRPGVARATTCRNDTLNARAIPTEDVTIDGRRRRRGRGARRRGCGCSTASRCSRCSPCVASAGAVVPVRHVVRVGTAARLLRVLAVHRAASSSSPARCWPWGSTEVAAVDGDLPRQDRRRPP